MVRATLAGMAMLVVACAAVPSSAGAAVKAKSLSSGQDSILKHGFKAKLVNKGDDDKKVKVKVESRTFDDQDWTKLTKTKKVAVDGDSKESARLKLNPRGVEAIASCAARDLRLKVGKQVRKRAELRRTSAACQPGPVDLSRASECDFIGQQDGSLCLLPFPDDYYTVADSSTATGRRVDLKTSAMPANEAGTHVAAAPYGLNDGFSQGQPIVVRVPGLDTPEALAKTDPAPLNHLGRYSEPDTPVVMIDANTGERWPIWVELDSNAGSPDRTAVLINPAVNLASGHRYIVAMRNLKTADGSEIGAPAGFRYYRDEIPSDSQPIEAQRPRFESIFQTLRDAGVRRSNLYLAWDFTVASDLNIAARALQIRNDAFATLGDTTMADMTVQGSSPAFSVNTVDDFTSGQNANVARRIRGTYTVPCYLQPNCQPGGRFVLGPDGLPTRNGDYQAKFDCVIPRVAVDGPTPVAVRPSLYGHGLFGTASQVFSGYQPQLAQDHGFILCATDEIGMASEDLVNTLGILGDLSDFPELADRLQEGLLSELFLGRLMIHPNGFSSNAAFHADGTLGTASVINTQRLFYDGNSQGGIMGGALAAVAPDFNRAALGVPAMRYSMLLPRSVDYDPNFSTPLNAAYTDPLERPLLMSLIQMLWDRGEPNGYAHRMTTDPLPDTPAHTILLGPAVGDHQVTNWATDIEARTIGAQAHDPIIDPGRWPDTDVLWNVPRVTSYPFTGSFIAYNDFGPVRPDPMNPMQTIGTPPDPLLNIPNSVGEDPHGAPRGIDDGLAEVSNFLQVNGAILNVCGPKPCYGGGWTGL